MKTEDEKLNEILVDALASALPGASVDEVDTTALRDALGGEGDLKRLHEAIAILDAGGDPSNVVDVVIRPRGKSRETLKPLVQRFIEADFSDPCQSNIVAPAGVSMTAIMAVADEIEAGTTDFDELRLLAAKHLFDAGGDPDDPDVVDAVIRAAEMTVHGTRVIDGFERLVA